MSSLPHEPHLCQCTIPAGGRVGWCPYHEVRKNSHWIHLCQTSKAYRALWNAGHGPGQVRPLGPPQTLRPPNKSKGPGGLLRKMLGCSARRWSGYAHMDRLGVTCGQHVDELAESLVDDGYVGSVGSAARMVRQAIRDSSAI